MCCTRLAENTGRKNSPSGHHRTNLSGYIFATKACIDNRKKLLNSNIFPTCPYNMVNFGLLAAEIVSLVWGTTANFNGFHILAALLRGTLVVGVSQTAALNRGRHLYSAGRPSRWALAHDSSSIFLWSPYVIGQTIILLPVNSIFSFFTARAMLALQALY